MTSNDISSIKLRNTWVNGLTVGSAADQSTTSHNNVLVNVGSAVFTCPIETTKSIDVTGSVFSTLITGKNAVLTGSAYTGTSDALGVIKTGSPVTTAPQQLLAGDDTLSAGSAKWTVFGEVFSAAPASITVTSTAAVGDLVVIAGSVTAGSFYVEGENASETYYWQAVGPV